MSVNPIQRNSSPNFHDFVILDREGNEIQNPSRPPNLEYQQAPVTLPNPISAQTQSPKDSNASPFFYPLKKGSSPSSEEHVSPDQSPKSQYQRYHREGDEIQDHFRPPELEAQQAPTTLPNPTSPQTQSPKNSNASPSFYPLKKESSPSTEEHTPSSPAQSPKSRYQKYRGTKEPGLLVRLFLGCFNCCYQNSEKSETKSR